jgi:hypothetical protein
LGGRFHQEPSRSNGHLRPNGLAGCLCLWLRKAAAFGCCGRAVASTAAASGGRWGQCQDQALAAYSLDARTRADFARTDVEQLRRFSGFIGKVQHNYLWDCFPATRRLLKLHKIETDFFAEYRAVQMASGRRAQKQPAKIRQFATYLSDFAARNPEFACLANILRYEYAGWKLRQSQAHYAQHKMKAHLAAEPIGALRWADFLSLVPVWNGPLCIESFDCEPAGVVASILDGTYVGYLAGADRLCALRLDPETTLLQAFEIDELAALLFSFIDGKRNVRSIIAAARRRALAATPPRAFRSFFEETLAKDFILLCWVRPCA